MVRDFHPEGFNVGRLNLMLSLQCIQEIRFCRNLSCLCSEWLRKRIYSYRLANISRSFCWLLVAAVTGPEAACRLNNTGFARDSIFTIYIFMVCDL